jgi:hypothetical protein
MVMRLARSAHRPCNFFTPKGLGFDFSPSIVLARMVLAETKPPKIPFRGVSYG